MAPAFWRAFSRGLWRFAAVPLFGVGAATSSLAARVGDASPPPPDAVRSSAQMPTPLQLDDSSSLRHGVVTALAPNGDRLQIAGIWLQVADGKTQVIRDGRAAPLAVLQKGDAVTFTLAPAAASAPSALPILGVIYAP